MLNLYRRHSKGCPHRAKGQEYTKCACPIWCDGYVNGKRQRQTLKTQNWQRAIRRLAVLEDPKASPAKRIADAITAFEQHCLSLEPSTQRKYANVLRHFSAYCERQGLEDLTEVGVEHIDGYRAKRKIARTTAQKELETLRQFFSFCRDRKWMDDNPAKRVKSPKNIKPAEVVPYTLADLARIVAACDEIGQGNYERLRARAMVLLLHHTALRVSDVATLARERVRDGQILVRTLKTGGTVYLPVPRDLAEVLRSLPAPRGSDEESRYFFWNGVTSRRAVVGIAERTLATLFKRSKVAHAHAHRFRHTLATRLLGIGASEQEVADVLGISPHIVRKHYAKWSVERQRRISGLFTALQAGQTGTFAVHERSAPVIN